MNAEAPRVAIAMGDPAGISPELMAKLLSQHDLLALAAITVIGDRRVLALGEKAAGLALDIETVDAADKAAAQPGKPIFLDLMHLDPATIPMAQATAEGGKFAMRNFGEALTAAKARRFDGIMFTPFNKLAFKRAGNPYPDEIRWASDLLGWNGACSEYNKLDNLWNARVTSHEPLREVPDMLTHDRIVSAIEATDFDVATCRHRTPANRSSGIEPACGRRWCVRSRRNRRDRASGGDGGEARPCGGRPVSGGHGMAARAAWRLRRGTQHVSRPGTDRAQTARLRARRYNPRRNADPDHDARARHGVRHSGQGDRGSIGDNPGIPHAGDADPETKRTRRRLGPI